jgi:hypothetical protein
VLTILSKMSTLCLACLILSTIARAQAPDPSKPAKEPIATIAGQPIYDDDLLPSVASQLMPLRNQEYQLKKKALENLIDQKLLEAEAKKRAFPQTSFSNKRSTPKSPIRPMRK